MLITNMEKVEIRNINIDLLKIVCMLGVIILHAKTYGVVDEEIKAFKYSYYLLNILYTLANVSVNCFVLISGYFMSQSKITKKKLIDLWLQVEFYSVFVYLAFCFIRKDVVFDIKVLIRQMLPLLTNQYWFFTMYLLLMLISPLLNRLIDNLNEEEHKKSLLFLILVFSVIPTINIFGDGFGAESGYSLLWFVVLYFLAAYIRKYYEGNKGGGRKKYICNYLLITTILCLVKISSELLADKIPLVSVISNLAYMYNSVLVLGASISLFLGALESNFKVNGKLKTYILKISKLTFGVYLFHENSQIRRVLWSEYVCLGSYASNLALFCMRLVCSVLIIFFIGVLIENIRKITVYKIANILVNKKYKA